MRANGKDWQNRLRSAAKRFSADRKGLAALELGLMAPMLVGAFIVMVDLGQAMSVRQDVAKKMRLGIEGLTRYNYNTANALSFANADGSQAFSGVSAAEANNAVVTITPYFICRETGTAVTTTTNPSTNCPSYEAWYRVAASNTSRSLFGSNYNVTFSADLLAE